MILDKFCVMQSCKEHRAHSVKLLTQESRVKGFPSEARDKHAVVYVLFPPDNIGHSVAYSASANVAPLTPVRLPSLVLMPLVASKWKLCLYAIHIRRRWIRNTERRRG